MNDIAINEDRIVGRRLGWCGEIMGLILGHYVFEIFKNSQVQVPSWQLDENM